MSTRLDGGQGGKRGVPGLKRRDGTGLSRSLVVNPCRSLVVNPCKCYIRGGGGARLRGFLEAVVGGAEVEQPSSSVTG